MAPVDDGEVTIHLHASLIDAVGADEVRIPLSAGSSTVSRVGEELVARHPRIKGLVPQCRWAVDLELVGPDFRLSDGQRIDLLPPFSGG